MAREPLLAPVFKAGARCQKQSSKEGTLGVGEETGSAGGPAPSRTASAAGWKEISNSAEQGGAGGVGGPARLWDHA